MATPRRRMEKHERRAQLLAAAQEVFGTRGHAGTTFEDIAARASVTRPLLYSHFRSVDELYIECHRAVRSELQERIVAAVSAEHDTHGALRAGAVAYLRFLEEEPGRWELLYGAAAGSAVAEVTAGMRFATAERLAAVFVAVAPMLDADVAVIYAHVVSGGLEQLAKWWRRHRELDAEEIADRFMDVAWTGLHVFAQPNRGADA